MFYDKSKSLSYIISFSVHIVVMAIMFFINFSIEIEQDEFVTIGFGTFGRTSSSGAIAAETETKKEDKKIVLPEAKNRDTDNVIAQEAPKEKKEEPPKQEIPTVEEEDSNADEDYGSGEGSYGFEIDFGGKGKRKIYSYNLPAYPAGVSKEIDVKLRFSILPDGSVGKIIPLIKADTRLEMAAINSLRQWRFEPLTGTLRDVEQNAIITFPYRLQ